MELLREFLRNYGEKFKAELEGLVKKYVQGEEEILKVKDAFFEQLFKERISKDFFYNLAYSYAAKGKNVKPVISKILLLTLKDFFEYLFQNREELVKRNIEEIKAFLTTIEDILDAVEKAYSDYFEKISEQLEEVKRLKEEKKKFMLKELEILKLKKIPATLIFSYKELPVYCKGIVEDIKEDVILLKIKEKCLIVPYLNVGEFFYMKADELTEPIRLEVLQKKDSTVHARAISYEETYIEKRQHVRVQPSKPIPIYIREKDTVGSILDISVGGVGVFLKKKVIEPQEVVTLEFELEGGEIRTKGECRYVISYREGYRAGFRFVDLDPKYESIIGRYVMKRQMEILKELREIMV